MEIDAGTNMKKTTEAQYHASLKEKEDAIREKTVSICIYKDQEWDQDTIGQKEHKHKGPNNMEEEMENTRPTEDQKECTHKVKIFRIGNKEMAM